MALERVDVGAEGGTAATASLTCAWCASIRSISSGSSAARSRSKGKSIFRRCTQCGERNLVREGDFFCAICDAELPVAWNFGEVVRPKT